MKWKHDALVLVCFEPPVRCKVVKQGKLYSKLTSMADSLIEAGIVEEVASNNLGICLHTAQEF